MFAYLALMAVVLGGPTSWVPRKPPVALVWGHELRDPARWPAEPPAPAAELIDDARFADAVEAVCGKRAARELAPPMLEAAREAGVDVFELAGLVYEQSGCDRKLWSRAGYGLLRLHPRMYFPAGGAQVAPPVPVERADLQPARLLDHEVSLRAGARLLAMWQRQHAAIDERFARQRGARHRSALSHFVWGDVVVSSAAEDRVLTARRRLLERYDGAPAPARATSLGIAIVSPLEGAPRVATSGPGEDREGGARRHRGVDITGAVGEPVRAIAGGEVTFAGVDLPGSSSHEELSPRASARRGRGETGPGGIFVCVTHDPLVTSCYFHLRRFDVRKGDRVQAGDVVGQMGLSGVRNALPHLHFELHVADRAQNPVPFLGSLVIPPRETVAYRNALAAQRARRLLTRNAARATFAPDGASPSPSVESARVPARGHGRARARVARPRLAS